MPAPYRAQLMGIVDQLLTDRSNGRTLSYETAFVNERLIPTLNKAFNHFADEVETEFRVIPSNSNYVTAVHYTSLEVVVSILNQAHSQQQTATPSPTDNSGATHHVPVRTEGFLRLYSPERSNDPQEGRYIKDEAQELAKKKGCDPTIRSLIHLIWPPVNRTGLVTQEHHNQAFLASFIRPTDNDPHRTADRLPFWRAYGHDGHGCAITTTLDHPRLFEVKYGAEQVRKFVDQMMDAVSPIAQLLIGDPTPEPERSSRLSDIISRNFLERSQGLHYLFKSSAYDYENECRVIILPGNEIHRHTEFVGPARGGVTTQYTEDIHLSTDREMGLFRSGSRITLGPRVRNPAATARYINYLLEQSPIDGCRVCTSQVQYQGSASS